eukprot:s227_g18.t1
MCFNELACFGECSAASDSGHKAADCALHPYVNSALVLTGLRRKHGLKPVQHQRCGHGLAFLSVLSRGSAVGRALRGSMWARACGIVQCSLPGGSSSSATMPGQQ